LSAHSKEVVGLCNSKDFNCAKSLVYSYTNGDRANDLDSIIKFLRTMKGNDAYKSNLLGVALMLKKDASSLDEAEKVLLESHNKGIKEAAQNLAELYFFKDNYDKSLVFLDIVKTYGYKFPDKKYINWTRLYAQILYLHPDEKVKNAKLALSFFSEIEIVDSSGIPEYFRGYDALRKGDVDIGEELLKKSSKYPNEMAAIYLADQYYTGDLLTRNIDLAKSYYLIAAELGNGRAYYNLAMISQEERDVDSMKRHLINSAKLGYSKAIELLMRARVDTSKS
jgi:TPR repeat protein